MPKLENILNMWFTRPHPSTSRVLKPHQRNDLRNMLLNKLFYISYPTQNSRLECSINFYPTKPILFEDIVEKILSMDNFNPENITKNYKTGIVTFKDTSAIKLLNIIFKDNENHVLYPIYNKWIVFLNQAVTL